jgi:phosphoribosylformimino-5-aminoimidazole carboxamide ribotide isomerase
VRVIPVIDLKDGVVVRGVAGRRAEYRPIESSLVVGSEPRQIAGAFVRLGLRRAYVADLDAIGTPEHRAEPNWDCYRAVMEAGLELWVDAGMRDERDVERLANYSHGAKRIDGVIVGLETLRDAAMLRRCFEIAGPERFVFSLDLRRGELLAQSDAWRGFSPLECGLAARDAGVTRMIVLDVSAVGIGDGVPTLGLCRTLRARSQVLEIVSGGGVRGIDDLRALAEAGCDGALVASALHDGRIGDADIARVTDERERRTG